MRNSTLKYYLEIIIFCCLPSYILMFKSQYINCNCIIVYGSCTKISVWIESQWCRPQQNKQYAYLLVTICESSVHPRDSLNSCWSSFFILRKKNIQLQRKLKSQMLITEKTLERKVSWLSCNFYQVVILWLRLNIQ